MAQVFKLEIDPHAKLPVYRQLIDQTHFAINTGVLAPGQRLPSLRDISTTYGIAVGTVVKAFKTVDGGPWLDGAIKQEDGEFYSPFVALDVP